MAIINLIWTSLYLEHWKRTSSFLAYRWGSWDTPISLLEEPRPLFKVRISFYYIYNKDYCTLLFTTFVVTYC